MENNKFFVKPKTKKKKLKNSRRENIEVYKELVISIIIVIVIFATNYITENFTQETIVTVSQSLGQIKEKLEKEGEDILENVNQTQAKWNGARNKLAYYIEHDELEKIETELIAMTGYIEQEEYAEAVASIEKTKYILEHLQEKEKLSLINIF